MKVVLLSCVKSKRSVPSKAIDMYTSALFKGSLKYAQTFKPDRMFILSAKYGLLDPEEVIEPYEQTLNGESVRIVQDWATRVLAQLRTKTDLQKDEFIFLAGQNYRKFLVPHMRKYEVPLEGLGMGKQLSFYSRLM